jgi:hypothetical protein
MSIFILLAKYLGPASKIVEFARHWWLSPVILATQEAEIRGSQFKASPGRQFTRPYLKKICHKKRAGGVAQGVGPKFKLQ